MEEFQEYSVVALTENLPGEQPLLRGQVGTIVGVWAPGVYEVEFCIPNGATYAILALKRDQLMQLHYEPVSQEQEAA